MDHPLYIAFTVAILAQAVKIFKALVTMPKRSKNHRKKEKAVKEQEKEQEKQEKELKEEKEEKDGKEVKEEKEVQTKTLIFISLKGDVLMSLGDDSEEIKWSSILEKIAREEWFLTCEKWKFLFGPDELKPGYVFYSESIVLSITCIKIFVPHISFELPSGEFLVSIPYESCNTRCKTWPETNVHVIHACFEAHKKLRTLGVDGYGTDRTKVHPLLNTFYQYDMEFPCDMEHPYFFRDKNGGLLELNDVLENPENDNLIIVAVPRKVTCRHGCYTDFIGPLYDGERRKVFCTEIILCPICGFLHCPSCELCK